MLPTNKSLVAAIEAPSKVFGPCAGHLLPSNNSTPHISTALRRSSLKTGSQAAVQPPSPAEPDKKSGTCRTCAIRAFSRATGPSKNGYPETLNLFPDSGHAMARSTIATMSCQRRPPGLIGHFGERASAVRQALARLLLQFLHRGSLKSESLQY